MQKLWDNLEKKTKWEPKSWINSMFKDKICKNKTYFFYKENTSELKSTNQTLDASHTSYRIQ